MAITRKSSRFRRTLLLALFCVTITIPAVLYHQYENFGFRDDLSESEGNIPPLLLESLAKPLDCDSECEENNVGKLPYVGLVHDKDSAYDLFDRASKRLGNILPNEPDWEAFPPQLVLDPYSKEGLVNGAMDSNIYDPAETADFQRDEGAHLELTSIQRGVRDATGCEAGDKQCFDNFMFRQSLQRKAWG